MSGGYDLEARYRTDQDLPLSFPVVDADSSEALENLYHYGESVARGNLLLTRSAFQLGLQFDAVSLFRNTYYLDDELQYERELVGDDLLSFEPDAYVNVEKTWLARDGTNGGLQIGDGYSSFGRGIVLNLRRNTDIDIDTSVRGLRWNLLANDWEVTLLTGLTNPQQVQQENPNLRLSPDRHNMVSGARVDRYGLGLFSLGLHGVAYSFVRETDASLFSAYGQSLDALAGGATVEALGLLGMDWFLEGDVFDYRSPDFFGGEEPERGLAGYGSVAAYVGPATLLWEVKHTENTERINTFTGAENYEVASGPTLEYERVITEDSGAALNSDDITAARLRVDVMAGAVTPHVAVAVMRDRDVGSLHFNQSPETIVHPVVGVDYLGVDAQLLLNAGYRRDIRDDFQGVSQGADQLLHLDVALDVALGGFHTEWIADVKQFQWGDNLHQQADFFESSVAVAVSPAEAWTVVLYQDYSDNPLLSSVGNLGDNLYGALELHYKANTATTLKAFYGAYKAGIRCAGGQCRNLPGFDGARVSMVSSF